MERYIAVGGHVSRIISYRDRELTPGATRRLAEPLVGLFRVMGRSRWPSGVDLNLEIDDRAAGELWESVLRSARSLRGHPVLSRFADRPLDGWETFAQIAVVLADGMTYAPLLLGDEDDRVPSGHASARTWRARAEAVELLLVSLVQYLWFDRRSLPSLARLPFERGLRGMCRHYGLLVQTLFEVGKRVTGRNSDCHVATLGGTAVFSAGMNHAWNWFISERDARVVAVDLTGADWLLDRQKASSIFNKGFDATRWNNVAVFLWDLLELYEQVDGLLYRSAHLQHLFPRLVEPQTLRGQVLLYNLARQAGLDAESRARIGRFLGRRGFDRHYPAWRANLQLTTLVGKIMGFFDHREQVRQESLLARLLSD